jgi:hypothetical protein
MVSNKTLHRNRIASMAAAGGGVQSLMFESLKLKSK